MWRDILLLWITVTLFLAAVQLESIARSLRTLASPPTLEQPNAHQ